MRRRMLPAAAVVVAVAAGCTRPSTGTRCADVARRGDHAATIATCTASHERTRVVADGVAAAIAHAERAGPGDDDAVLAWADRLGDAPEAAAVWRRAAAVHDERDAGDAALAARERAMRAWEAAGKFADAAYETHAIFTARWDRSELALALDTARRGRAFAVRSDDRGMDVFTLGNLFSVLDEIGDTAGAAAVLDEARARADDDRKMQFYVAFYDGLLRFHQGRLAAARASYRTALTLADAANDEGTVRATHYNLVEIEVALGDIAAARRELERALALVPADAPPYMRPAVAYFTALVALAEKQPAPALAAIAPALAASPSPDWAWQLEELAGRALEAQGALAAARAAYLRAITMVETMRRDVAVDALQLALRDRKRGPYEAVFELAARAGRRDDALAVAEQMWIRRFTEAFADTADAVASEDSASARIAGVTTMAPAVHASPLLEADRPPGAPTRDVIALIEARGSIWRYTHAGGRDTLERLPAPAADIATRVADLRAAPDDRAIAGGLGATLIPPYAAVASDRPLHVIADGALGGLPFAALIAGGKRLVQLRPIAIAPSLAAVASPPRGDRGGTPVVIGASTASAPLPAASGEARDVGQLLGVTPAYDDRATSDAVKGARAASLLHVAAHGGIDARGAYITLADRRLDAADVVAWRIAPRVVVLASCASGARPGRTMWGAMGAAFLAAGSRAVVATLWSVGDEQTRDLVRAFYVAGGAENPSLALARAQRAAIDAGRPASEWAPFVVLGAP